PGIPQAWAMSVWNPSPYFVIKSEMTFLKTNFNSVTTVPIGGGTLGGSQRLAIQPQVNPTGQFELVDDNLGIDTPYLVAPRITMECFGSEKIHSFEAGFWASVGPARNYTLGNNDFPYFVTDPVTVAGAPLIPVINAPLAF